MTYNVYTISDNGTEYIPLTILGSATYLKTMFTLFTNKYATMILFSRLVYPTRCFGL